MNGVGDPVKFKGVPCGTPGIPASGLAPRPQHSLAARAGRAEQRSLGIDLILEEEM